MKEEKQICIGILAHVDSGKTTLSESLLYLSGSIRKMGRVDKQDTFLDTHELERGRGITIFSKQAVFSIGDKNITLLDTPGHVDFSAEMERTLQILDYAILVVSGADGVQGHTQTLWKLLKRYQVPVFIFINKMDQQGTKKEDILAELKQRLDENCIEFGLQNSEEFLEQLAMCEESVLETYLESGSIEKEEIVRLIANRRVFPCCFGSALKLEGVKEFLELLDIYLQCPSYKDKFSAKVFKISRDEQGNRLTWMKITGGSLKVKTLLSGMQNGESWEEKVNQIRIYSGVKFEAVTEVFAGMVCAVTGLSKTYAGEGLGFEQTVTLPLLEPVLNYQIQLPDGCDPMQMMAKLRVLEEEEPQLHLRWDEQLQEIQAQLMGEVQIEILKSLIKQRFDVDVEFGEGEIVYKETIENMVEGVGHFEPLRHYAEVHLLLEPGKLGSGLEFATACSEDILDKNWQRLILTHLEERMHKGVLIGAEITDMKITLVSGKAHLKHTEGGDFRQATYRAVRQGLMQAKSVLLEPYYEFRLEVPTENIGRAMSDIEKMQGTFESPELEGEMSILIGSAAVSKMRNYQQELISYTKGKGRLSCNLKGYFPCKNADEIIQKRDYHPELDMEHSPDSVFCYHGAGTIIPWQEVYKHMHLENVLSEKKIAVEEQMFVKNSRREKVCIGTEQEEKELEEIFQRTFGTAKNRSENLPQTRIFGEKTKTEKRVYLPKERLAEYLLVDGYNIIFAWEELQELAKVSIDAARNKLMDVLCNYQGLRGGELILVFDAYRVEGHVEEIISYHNIYIVYTKEAETADQYIERTAHKMHGKYKVTVATSDGLEQIIIRGQGCALLSARELREDIERVNEEMRKEYLEKFPSNKNYLFDSLPEEFARDIQEVRMGRKSFCENGE